MYNVSRLRIRNLRVTDSGMFRCEGQNQWGREATEAALLVSPGKYHTFIDVVVIFLSVP